MAKSLSIDEVKKIMGSKAGFQNIDVFVETGTFLGATVKNVCRYFKEVHTIELSKELYQKAKSKFRALPINFHFGDSRFIINELASKIQKSVVWFLDAHWSHGPTAGNEKGQVHVPLMDELKSIVERNFSDLIIIDDVRLFGTNKKEDWSNVSYAGIINMLQSRDYEVEMLNDRMLIYLRNK